MKRSSCRSCGAPIVWTTTVGGKAMPVDALPAEGGSIALDEDDDIVFSSVVPAAERAGRTNLHHSHFVTCPHAAKHRRAR